MQFGAWTDLITQETEQSTSGVTWFKRQLECHTKFQNRKEKIDT